MEKVLVIGLGVSGRAAAELLLKKGYSVIGVDRNRDHLENNNEILALLEIGLETYFEDDIQNLKGINQVILSPGIPQSHPICKMALAEGIELYGEIELGCRMVKNRMLGITGTNGKTTVTLFVAHVLNSVGIKARALGNVGVPLTKELLDIDSHEVLVVELSSYQLETLFQKVLDGAVLLNITPDHLDRYGSMETYAKAKFKIADCLKPNAPFFVEAKTWNEYGSLSPTPNVFKYGYNKEDQIFSDLQVVYLNNEPKFHLPKILQGRESHDAENLMAAFALCQLLDVSPEQFTDAYSTFCKPPHRLEWVRELEGVHYFDDSKGTNIDATIRAVESMPGKVVLIAGGVDKGFPYTTWIQAFANKVKCICAIGRSADKIRKDLDGAIQVKLCINLEEAVKKAKAAAQPGDTVLLSPGCSSFDMFRDYAHRGEEFQRVVKGL